MSKGRMRPEADAQAHGLIRPKADYRVGAEQAYKS